MSTFDGTCQWMGKEVRISLDVEIEKKASWTRANKETYSREIYKVLEKAGLSEVTE